MSLRAGVILIAIFLSQGLQPAKITWEALHWQSIRTTYFDIHYPPGYEFLGEEAARTLESASISISGKLNHRLSTAIPVFVYPSPDHFRSTNIIPQQLEEGVGGFTERLKKRVVVPYAGSLTEFRHVLAHELVHAYQYDMLYGQAMLGGFFGALAASPPLWYIEGMAEYLSIGWDENADMVLRDAVLGGTMPGITDMTTGRVTNGYIFYKGGAAAVAFIDETWGSVKLGELLKDMRDQRSVDDAFRVNLGIPMSEVDRGFQRFLLRKYSAEAALPVADESSNIITRHLEDRSFLNMHPAISPDGKKIAWISIRSFFPAVVIRETPPVRKPADYRTAAQKRDEDGEKPREKILLRAGRSRKAELLNLLGNRLSFSDNARYLWLLIHSGGRDSLVSLDTDSGKIHTRIPLPVDEARQPFVDPSGRFAVFTGSIAGVSDIYLISLPSAKGGDYRIRRISWSTDSETSAIVDPSGTVFIAVQSEKDGSLLRYSSGIFTKILNTPFPVHDLFFCGRRLCFVAAPDRIRRIYMVDDDGNVLRVSDWSSAVLSPSLDQSGSKLIYSVYRDQGHNIGISEFPPASQISSGFPATNNYPEPSWQKPADPSDQVQVPYRNRASLDWLFFGVQYSTLYGFGGFAQFSGTDLTGDHSVSGFVDYLSFTGRINFNVRYSYLKYRTKFYVGASRTTTVFNIFSVTNPASLTDLFYFPRFIERTNQYGIYAGLIYPLTAHWALNAQWRSARIEELYFDDLPARLQRPDVFSNIHSVSGGISYSNVVYSPIGPLTGGGFVYITEQSLNAGGRDYVFTRQILDARNYLYLGGRYIFASRVMAGRVSGPESIYFPFHVGGFNTVRGYPFLGFRGESFLLANLEFRYPLIEALLIGIPAPWILPGVSGTAFVDAATVFGKLDTANAFREGVNRDLIASFGLGIRFPLLPGLNLRIDWATPWDGKRNLPASRWPGIFSIGYEF